MKNLICENYVLFLIQCSWHIKQSTYVKQKYNFEPKNKQRITNVILHNKKRHILDYKEIL